MNKMILGGVTFTENPKINFPVIKPKKVNAVVDTYDGVAYFGWTPRIIGTIIPLEWDWMSAAQFDSLNTLYQSDGVVVFDPSGGIAEATTYNVIVKELDGVYWLNLDTNEAYREKVKMELLIMSQN